VSQQCTLCGKPGATVAYFSTGDSAVTYRHYDCDKGKREISAAENRQQWGLDQWLNDGS
jgi:hypothetical protein